MQARGFPSAVWLESHPPEACAGRGGRACGFVYVSNVHLRLGLPYRSGVWPSVVWSPPQGRELAGVPGRSGTAAAEGHRKGRSSGDRARGVCSKAGNTQSWPSSRQTARLETAVHTPGFYTLTLPMDLYYHLILINSFFSLALFFSFVFILYLFFRNLECLSTKFSK